MQKYKENPIYPHPLCPFNERLVSNDANKTNVICRDTFFVFNKLEKNR